MGRLRKGFAQAVPFWLLSAAIDTQLINLQVGLLRSILGRLPDRMTPS
jgi:hypothetical protein